jgi:radical SAM family RiPP maturation amino acid epimerase
MTGLGITEYEQVRAYRTIYSGHHDCDPEILVSIANTKRFLERWVADESFRAEVLVDAQSAADRHGIPVDAEAIRPLWDPGSPLDLVNVAASVQHYRAYCREKLAMRDRMRIEDGEPDHPLFRKWRQRQINRFFRQVPLAEAAAVVHAPFAVELNHGCSVGCWFCGVAAPPLSASFAYTPDNARFWQEVLQELHTVIGTGAQTGFCYWATDPLDNPDYEHFLRDFDREFNRYPQTTTAQPLRDIPRMRAILAQTTERRPMINRFSTLSLPMFNAVHRQYTAMELLHVEIVCQQPQSIAIKAQAGRARNVLIPSPPGETLDHSTQRHSTIACVSGFLINMPLGEVRLISPVPASERWPLGYRVYGQASFTDIASFRRAINGLISSGMRDSLRIEDIVGIAEDLEIACEDNVVSIHSDRFCHKFTDCENNEALLKLLQRLRTAPAAVEDLMIELQPVCALPRTFQLLNLLLNIGLIDDEQFISKC